MGVGTHALTAKANPVLCFIVFSSRPTKSNRIFFNQDISPTFWYNLILKPLEIVEFQNNITHIKRNRETAVKCE